MSYINYLNHKHGKGNFNSNNVNKVRMLDAGKTTDALDLCN